ncbi:hypothetical protein NKG94_50160 [Micromonospora sp. M12]
MQNFPFAFPEFAGVRLTEVDVEIDVTKFDLGLTLDVSTGVPFLRAEYSTELFTAETVGTLLTHYLTFLRSIVDEEQREPSMVDEAERAQLTEGEPAARVGAGQAPVGAASLRRPRRGDSGRGGRTPPGRRDHLRRAGPVGRADRGGPGRPWCPPRRPGGAAARPFTGGRRGDPGRVEARRRLRAAGPGLSAPAPRTDRRERRDGGACGGPGDRRGGRGAHPRQRDPWPTRTPSTESP